jgi:uncharacterized protein YdiU (UPF0061 family)
MHNEKSPKIATLDDLAKYADYSLVDSLNCDPESKVSGDDHFPREVFRGHYVPVNPTPIPGPEYISHSKIFFFELGFLDSMANSKDFMKMFSGDLSLVPKPMRRVGWATGYALSIFGTEYYQQCPFQTGNGYGDGRAISVLEVLINNKRWEMQLKGGGRTPYCRGADGRAVLRSSVREFLAQEHMHALSVPTSRSLSLYVSKTEKVQRPWFSDGSLSMNPDLFISEATAISTRVASSFIRVGQIELFARRARKNEHPKAMEELEKIVLHLIDREYADVIDKNLSTTDKVLFLAKEFRDRLTSLVANWIRVGFCQGNFNSDNCAAGGFTLDYGPFGFCDDFNPTYQSWTGGGNHFAFLNQPVAAQRNFQMFCISLRPLLASNQESLQLLEEILAGFPQVMESKMEKMWASKLGLKTFNLEILQDLIDLMMKTSVDYTLFFRELSSIPENIGALKKSFYMEPHYVQKMDEIDKRWSEWLSKWNSLLEKSNDSKSREEISREMKLINPKYTLREWFLVPAYKKANAADYSLVRELQKVMTRPYDEQSKEVEEKYYKLKPSELFAVAGVSHVSCSS